MGIVPDPVPPTDEARRNLPGFYIGENITNTPEDVAQHGNTTYAWIQTRFSLDNTAVVNGEQIEYSGPAIDGTEDFHLISLAGIRDYICTPAKADAVYNFLDDPTRFPGDVTSFEYKQGYVYYRVFLNRTGTNSEPIPLIDKYNVYRNQFIHMDVLAVNMNGNSGKGFGGGYPGDPDDLKVPINPFTQNPDPPADPVNPDPHTREEPIDEEEATLRVNIEVKDWEYRPNGITLE